MREKKQYTPKMVEPEDIKVGHFGRFYLEDLEKDAPALYGLYQLAGELAPRAEEADFEGTLLFARIVRSMAAELERADLIERRRQGQGKSARIYVKRFRRSVFSTSGSPLSEP